MENKPNNPHAFPQDANTCLDEYRGMTLRDHFAGLAMQGILANPNIGQALSSNGSKSIQDSDTMIVVTSYRIADSMLKQRELNLESHE